MATKKNESAKAQKKVATADGGFRLDINTKAALKKIADHEERSLNWMCNHALKEFVSNYRFLGK